MAKPQVLVLDDQALELAPSVQRLEQFAKISKELQQFLRNVADHVQLQAAALSPVELQAVGCQNAIRFENLLDLAQACDENVERMGFMHSVLACVCCIGELLIHVENRHYLLGLPDANVYVLGLGTSLLCAAALGAARNMIELSEIGIETISIAFRLALELRQRSMQIDHVPGNWARTVTGIPVEEMASLLDNFHKLKGTPVQRQIYLAEESQNWVTVSGPPSTLAQLFIHSSDLKFLPTLSASAHSALHAKHLCRLDVDWVVGTSPLLQKPVTPNFHISSSTDCSPYPATNLGALLRTICHGICHERVRLVKMSQTILASLADTQNADMIMVGPTIRTKDVRDILKGHKIQLNLIENPSLPRLGNRELRGGSGSIAIIGMAGRFPGSNDITEFWESLLSGKEFHKKVPEDRFHVSAWNHVVGDTSPLPHGCFLDQPGLFDNHLFNISPREAIQMCPSQRLLLTVSYEALQRAGYSREGTLSTGSSRVATYFGQTTDDWRDVTNSRGIDIYYIPSLMRSFAPGRLNYHYKWEGPSYSIDSTCASSASAIGLACTALIARECDTALAGGVNTIASPAMFAGLKKGGFLSPTGSCKTFREDADGYCCAEGVGVVVLKRLEDAIHDNDNVLAIIRGQARNHSANAVSITNPHVGAQERLYRKTLRAAGVDSSQISYVEMHGTGTHAGDLTETTAVVNVYCKRRPESNPLVVGAVKANVGHAEAAAGVISMIKSVMILKTGKIPPQPGMPFKLNPKLPLPGRTDVQVAARNMHLPPRASMDESRKLVLNNFDASGGNVCFVVEEGPKKVSKRPDMRSYHVVAISARTPVSLKENKKRLLGYLIASPKTKLQDLSYTTTARAMHERLKVAYVAKSISDMIQQIREDSTDFESLTESTTVPKLVFVCTGMSAQYSGMGAELFRMNTRFRRSILSMQKLCDSLHLPSIVELISDPAANLDTKTTTQIQLAIVALELSLAQLWRSWGIEPSLVIGHSLGEYAALCIAGVLSISDTLRLVGLRASLMEEKLSLEAFAMLAVAASSTDVVRKLADSDLRDCNVSCLNGPSSTVVSGPTKDIQTLKQNFQSEGTRATWLKTQHGFHSSQFDPILTDFAARAKAAQFSAPKIPVASTLLGTVVYDAGVFDADYLARQTRNPVQFIDAVNACAVEGLADSRAVWLEVGPDQVCINFIRAIIQADNLLPTITRREPNWKTIASAASALYRSNVPIAWPEYHKEYLDCLSLIELPTYAFDEKNFWTTFKHTQSVCTSQAVLDPCHKPNLSMSLHSVEEEYVAKGNVIVKFISPLVDNELFNAVQGHHLENAALCPSSVFCDMALTAASYVQSKKWQGDELAMEIKNLTLEHPIVVPESRTSNYIKVSAVMNIEGRPKVDITFNHSFQTFSQDTGNCQIVFGNLEQWKVELSTSSFFVKARAESVIDMVKSGRGYHLQKPIVYKIFSNAVKYSSPYQAIDELFWDEISREAVAMVKLQPHRGADYFPYSPYWLDSIIHLAGFILNANLTTPDDIVYIFNGFKSMRILASLSMHKHYQSYVRQHKNQQKGLSYSDIYLFEREELVAVCYGIRFQRLPRAAFRRILHESKNNAYGKGPDSRDVELTQVASPINGKRNDSVRTTTSTDTLPPLIREAAAEAKDKQAMSDILIKVVTEETGVRLDDIGPTTKFAEMGVDSLLSIAIIDRVRKFTGVQLGASFFMENKTVGDASKTLQKSSEPLPIQSSSARATVSSTTLSSSAVSVVNESHGSSNPSESHLRTPVSETTFEDPATLETSDETKSAGQFTSRAVLIHGTTGNLRTSLFLVCDGAGSATAYLHLPRFSSDLPTYALESPFLHCPQEYSYTVEETAVMYIATIRELQPHGPYMIGGWSAGGLHAYEICRQLLALGETISSLVILDMHVPRPMPDGHEVTLDFIERIGVAAGIKRTQSALTPTAMSKLKQHLLHTIKSLASYRPLPMHPTHRPAKTVVIWARRSLSEVFGPDERQDAADIGLRDDVEGNVMEDPEMDLCAWFFSKRYKFGANGWDDLLGPVECHSVDADHFSMVLPPAIDAVSQLLEQALAPIAT